MNYFKSSLLAPISPDKLKHIDVGIHVHSNLYLKMCERVLTYVGVLGESSREKEKHFLKLQNRDTEILMSAFTFAKRKRKK